MHYEYFYGNKKRKRGGKEEIDKSRDRKGMKKKSKGNE
jgi:hypothetical protein